MKPGQKLIAIEDHENPKLTISKEYEVVKIIRLADTDDRCFILDDNGQVFEFSDCDKGKHFQTHPTFGIWQPIETAPKDGTVFIGLDDDEVYKMKWDLKRNRIVLNISDEPYHKIHSWGSEFDYEDLNPTHWMPLPELPKE